MSEAVFRFGSQGFQYRVRYLQILLFLGTCTSLVLVPLHLGWGLQGDVVISVLYAASCVAGLWVLHKRPALAGVLANILMVATMMATVGSTYFETPEVVTDPWILVCPVVAFAIYKKETAVRWTLFALLSLFVVRYFQIYRFSMVSTLLLAFTMMAVSIVLYLFSGQIEQNERLIIQLGNTDPLTNTLNRRSLDEALQNEFRRNQRQGTSMTVLMIDVDLFKHYNDQYGHIKGDEVLVRIAQNLMETAQRSGDFVFRYGGEEFLILCSGLEASHVVGFAERLRANVESLAILHERVPGGKVTVSIGYRHADSLAELTPADLIAQSDRALYRAKALGRNRVETCPAEDVSAP